METILHAHTHAEPIAFSIDSIFHVTSEAFIDTLKLIPFLFIAFLAIEFLETKAQDKMKKMFFRAGKFGPVIGALLGCVPQCGFSVLSANLYMGGFLGIGTLIAVFLSTSDEAVILLAAHPNAVVEILRLLVTKIVIAIVAGYVVTFIHNKFFKKEKQLTDICEFDRCGCEENDGILIPALVHTAKVFGFLLLFTLLINFFAAFVGTEILSHLLLENSILQPFFAALIGFIPNCAASVLLTQLYLEGVISFGSVVAGLCTGAGTGLLVLFREKSRLKDSFKVAGILYICAVIPSVILHLLGI